MQKPITPRRIRYAADKIAKAFMEAVAADMRRDAELDRMADEFDRVMAWHDPHFYCRCVLIPTIEVDYISSDGSKGRAALKYIEADAVIAARKVDQS